MSPTYSSLLDFQVFVTLSLNYLDEEACSTPNLYKLVLSLLFNIVDLFSLYEINFELDILF